MSYAAERASELLDKFASEVHKTSQHPDPEAVHDLRVAIRRLRQCLSVFEDSFPPESRESIAKKLRKLLGKAGEVRNFDIAVELLKKDAAAAPLLHAIRRDRDDAAGKYRHTLSKVDGRGAAGKWRHKLLGSAAEASDPKAIAAHARQLLPSLAAAFFDAGDRATQPSASPQALHKFRIQSKKFRYAMELFVPLYGRALDPRLAALRKVQTYLGEINDCVATATLLAEYEKHHAIVERSLARLEQIGMLKISTFRSFWNKSLDTKQKNSWIRYLRELKSS